MPMMLVLENCHHEEGEQGSQQARLLRLLGQFSPTRDLLSARRERLLYSIISARKDSRSLAPLVMTIS